MIQHSKWILPLTVATLFITGCSAGGSSTPSSSPTATSSDAITTSADCIGVTLQATAASARWESQDHPQLQAALAKYAPNAEVDFVNAEGSAATQLTQAEAFITKGCKVLIVAPVDGVADGQIAQKAQAAGVKLIAYDALILNAPVDAYVSFDNVKVGELMGTWVQQNTKQGDTIGIISGSPTDNNATMFQQGALNILQPLFDSGDRVQGYKTMTPDWSSANAQTEAEQMLSQLNNNVQAVVVGNDNLATGVIAALKEQGLNGKVGVTGQDATVVGLQQIVTGDQGMTVWKPIAQEADAAAQLAAYMLNGTQPPASLLNGTTDNGSGTPIPSVLLTPISVTLDNMESTVIQAGVATKDQICQGLPQPCALQ